MKELYEDDWYSQPDKKAERGEQRKYMLEQIPEGKLNDHFCDHGQYLRLFAVQDQIGRDHPEQNDEKIRNSIFNAAVHNRPPCTPW